jgi:hypothetical protein
LSIVFFEGLVKNGTAVPSTTIEFDPVPNFPPHYMLISHCEPWCSTTVPPSPTSFTHTNTTTSQLFGTDTPKRKRTETTRTMVAQKRVRKVIGPKHIKRAMNSFMCFSKKQRRLLNERFCDVENTKVTQEIARMWHSLSEDAKLPYKLEAALHTKQLKLRHPDYGYAPRTTVGLATASPHKASPLILQVGGVHFSPSIAYFPELQPSTPTNPRTLPAIDHFIEEMSILDGNCKDKQQPVQHPPSKDAQHGGRGPTTTDAFHNTHLEKLRKLAAAPPPRTHPRTAPRPASCPPAVGAARANADARGSTIQPIDFDSLFSHSIGGHGHEHTNFDTTAQTHQTENQNNNANDTDIFAESLAAMGWLHRSKTVPGALHNYHLADQDSSREGGGTDLFAEALHDMRWLRSPTHCNSNTVSMDGELHDSVNTPSFY